MVSQVKQSGAEDQLGSTGNSSWNSGGKRLDDLWKQGQALQEDYRAVVGIRREKTRKAKAQLELKLTSVVPDNKKGFS